MSDDKGTAGVRPGTEQDVPQLGTDTKEDIQLVEFTAGLETKWDDIKAQADRAEEFEHSQTLWQALKHHRRAAMWSGVISLSIIMEAFDTSLGGQFALVQFRKSFGSPTGTGDYQVSAGWQTAINYGPTIGQWIGVPFGTYLVDHYGYRWSIMSNMVLIIPCIAISVFAVNKPMLLMGGVCCGVPWGAFQTLSEAYATEVTPLTLRAYMTGWINFCWVFGGLVASGVLQGTQGIPSSYAWRIPYMLQWIWPVPMVIILYLAPESPWWLVRKGRPELAERSIQRLAAHDEIDRTSETLANMIRTTEFEKEQAKSKNNGRWVDLFRGVDLRRTEITCMAWACQNLCGSGFVANTGYIMEQAGISQEASFRFGFGSNVITLAANLVSFYMMKKMGRRTIYIVGQTVLCVGLIVIGCCAVAIDHGAPGAQWAQASMQIVSPACSMMPMPKYILMSKADLNACYVAFLGPTCYAVVGEASSTRLRNKSVSAGRLAYFAVGMPMGFLITYQINPTAWNWQGKAAFFWAGIALIGLVWSYFRLPEFKGRSYFELDVLFARKTPTKQFKHAVVERHADDHIQEQASAEGRVSTL